MGVVIDHQTVPLQDTPWSWQTLSVARMVSNGAIVDDSGQWYWNSRSWSPLVSNPSSKQPGAFLGKDRRDIAHLLRGRGLMDMGKVEAAGKDFARLVSLHGDVATAELALTSETIESKNPRATAQCPYSSIERCQRTARSR